MNITSKEFEKQFREYFSTLQKPESVSGFMGNWAWYLHAKNEFKKKFEEQGHHIEVS